MADITIGAIIPARGGSKGVFRKNVRQLNGKPLLSYTIHAAHQSRYVDRVFVSTEDNEIAATAEEYGAEVIDRPSELAQDDTGTREVVIHALDCMQQRGYSPDVLVLLQATSPLRTGEDIDHALEIFFSSNCDSVVSVAKATHSPLWAFTVKKEYISPLFPEEIKKNRRQDLGETVIPNGAIYVIKPAVLLARNAFITDRTVPYIMPKEKSIDIDTEVDLLLAEILLQRGQITGS